jgi:hypothetical protein
MLAFGILSVTPCPTVSLEHPATILASHLIDIAAPQSVGCVKVNSIPIITTNNGFGPFA